MRDALLAFAGLALCGIAQAGDATRDYSPALTKAGFVWDARSLERWIADPESVVPGQRMGVRVNDAGERADIVAFLLTLKP
jgi:cytochrome c